MITNNSVRARLAQLNSAIFNGRSTVNVYEVKVVRNRKLHPEYLRKYEMNLDFRTATVSRGSELFDSGTDRKSISLMNTIDHNMSETVDQDETAHLTSFKLDSKMMSDDMLAKAEIKHSIISFDIPTYCPAGVSIDHIYIKNYLITDGPASSDILKINKAETGNCKRNSHQDLMVPINVKTLLIIFTNTISLPIILGYDVEDIDYSMIFNPEDTSCIFNSYSVEFSFNDTINLATKPIHITQDHRFYKANSVLNCIKDENLTPTFDGVTGDILKYDYTSEYIVGEFDAKNVDAKFWLKGDDKRYLLFSTNDKYNTNMVQTILRYFKDSDKAEDVETFNAVRTKVSEWCKTNPGTRNVFYDFLHRIEGCNVFKDEYNEDTYHIAIDDSPEMYSHRLYTIYGNEYVVLRELMGYGSTNNNNADATLVFILYRIPDDPDNENLHNMLNGITSYSGGLTENGYSMMNYSCNYQNLFNFTGALSRRKESTPLTNINGERNPLQLFEYHSPDLENMEMVTVDVETDSVDIITKCDSLLYNRNQVDEVIVRNNLGLPLNHRYIGYWW